MLGLSWLAAGRVLLIAAACLGGSACSASGTGNGTDGAVRAPFADAGDAAAAGDGAGGHANDGANADAPAAETAEASLLTRPRVLIETAASVDEQASLARLLFFADQLEVAGVIVTGSDPGAAARVLALLAAYRDTWASLRRFGDYQPAQSISDHVVTFLPTGATAAANAAVAATLTRALGSDVRPVHYLGWVPGVPALRTALDFLAAGGPAQATGVVALQARLRVYGLAVDTTLGPHTGALGLIVDLGSAAEAAQRAAPLVLRDLRVADPVSTGGALGAALARLRDRSDVGFTESAALSFLPLLPGGPGLPAQPDWGGWGGRFVASPLGLANVFVPAPADEWAGLRGPGASVARFAAEANADFRAHLLRGNPAAAAINRPPLPRVAVTSAAGTPLLTDPGSSFAALPAGASAAPLLFEVTTGAALTIDARGSTDPDAADTLGFAFRVYDEAGRFPGAVVLRDDGTGRAQIEIPERLAERQTVHVILSVTDTGTPTLTRYRRLIFQRTR